VTDALDVSARMAALDAADPATRGLSPWAAAVQTSEILTIAYQVRERIAAGEDILNLTVGDFSPAEFPIPRALADAVTRAVQEGQTNYPPAPGLPETRDAVCDYLARRMGVRYPRDSVLIVSGARPAVFGTYASVVSRGDRVVYGLPSWNNHHYANLVGAQSVEIETDPESRFFLTPDSVEPHLSTARLLCLNSPQNPSGTVMRPSDLEAISRMVVDENARRAQSGAGPLYVMFDQIYWPLTFGGVEHVDPVRLVPEMADYTFFVDGISKAFAATGLRVGWCVGPSDVIRKMTGILAHTGCWAPRPIQAATARLLADDEALDAYLESMRAGVLRRLELLYEAITAFAERGFDVACIRPQGAIYLSVKLNLVGRRTTDGRLIENDEDTRVHFLEHAGVALVPFRAFGVPEGSHWFRASVGVASIADCEGMKARLDRAFSRIAP
jgi:aspartate aminotransferase